MNTNSGYFKIDQANLYFEIAGKGKPLVFIHAGIADSRMWTNEFEYFQKKNRVFRYDQRGFGKSLPVKGGFSHMQDLIGLLDSQAINQPIVLIGCSMGGSLAMDFALAYPEKVEALVMVCSDPSGLVIDIPDHPLEASIDAADEANDLALVNELETQLWFDGKGRKPDQVNQVMRQLTLDMNGLALAHQAKELGEQLPNTDSHAVNRLHELSMPVLIVTGELDIDYSQASASYMMEHIPNAQKEIIMDAAHLPNLEHPQKFQQVLDIFLKNHNL